jgi:hypothetical protein
LAIKKVQGGYGECIQKAATLNNVMALMRIAGIAAQFTP